jgi:glutathione S-transferase
MKLFYSPGACSLSPHIVAEEAGIKLQLEQVDLKAKRTTSGRDYTSINPKGYVPALELDDGDVLTEGPAIVQYLADQKPGTAPAAGSRERYHLQEWLAFINSEIHKTYSPMFSPTVSDAVRQERSEYLKKRYAVIEQHLAQHQYLVGDAFSPADAYLYTVTRWAGALKIDLSGFPQLTAFQKRIGERAGVRAALKAEGLQ